MAVKDITSGMHIFQNSNAVDYVKDGVLYRGGAAGSVLVESSDDLAGIAQYYTPGTFAYTAGQVNVWQLGTDGTWTAVE